MDKFVEQWYSGAECELNSLYGYARTHEEKDHIGLGQATREVECAAGCRRGGVADELGLLGHRLAWAARGVHLMLRWIVKRECTATPNQISAMRRTGEAYAHRAVAFLREKVVREPAEEDKEAAEPLVSALKLMASMVRTTHRRRPLLAEGEEQRLAEAAETFAQTEMKLAEALGKLAERRRSRKLKATKAWAAAAPLKVAHAVTKPREVVTTYSASASKSHLGEATAQEAADKGITEWSVQWNATDCDESEAIMQKLEEQIACGPSRRAVTEEGEYEAVEMPPITGWKLWKCARMIKGDTGLGLDFLRPRHVSILSQGAREALARLLKWIEKRRRWPELLRRTVAVTLGKKGGREPIGGSPHLPVPPLDESAAHGHSRSIGVATGEAVLLSGTRRRRGESGGYGRPFLRSCKGQGRGGIGVDR